MPVGQDASPPGSLPLWRASLASVFWSIRYNTPLANAHRQELEALAEAMELARHRCVAELPQVLWECKKYQIKLIPTWPEVSPDLMCFLQIRNRSEPHLFKLALSLSSRQELALHQCENSFQVAQAREHDGELYLGGAPAEAALRRLQ